MKPNQKLYVITRSDLTPGEQAVQGMHAIVEFMQEYSEHLSEWHTVSNYLCFLVVSNEQELKALEEEANSRFIKTARFLEPDLDNTLTAVVLGATNESSELVRGLPLALKGLWHSDSAGTSNVSQVGSTPTEPANNGPEALGCAGGFINRGQIGARIEFDSQQVYQSNEDK